MPISESNCIYCQHIHFLSVPSCIYFLSLLCQHVFDSEWNGTKGSYPCACHTSYCLETELGTRCRWKNDLNITTTSILQVNPKLTTYPLPPYTPNTTYLLYYSNAHTLISSNSPSPNTHTYTSYTHKQR